MTLLRLLTFLLRSLAVTLTVLHFMDLFISSDASIFLVVMLVVFRPSIKSDYVFISVSIVFPSNSKQDAPF